MAQPTRRYRFVLVDVFTRRPFGGNQLAVFTDARGLADAEMQAIAHELNFSETTFVLPPDDPAADARVRIFTPARELPFAGHPTVGTGFVLGSERGKPDLALQLQVGTLGVSVDAGDGRAGSAAMEQPLPQFRPAETDPVAVVALVGLPPADLATFAPPEYGSAGVEFLFLPLRSLEAVRQARNATEALQRFFAGSDHPAVYLFSTETESPEATTHARMFFLVGGEAREDPATGGASGPFGAYLVRHGLARPGRLLLEQGYEMGRPSLIEVDIEATDGEISRVRVGGGVVRLAEGEFTV